MREKVNGYEQFTVDEVNAALAETASELEADKHPNFWIDSIYTCILTIVSSKLISDCRCASIHCKRYGLPDEYSDRLHTLGFEYPDADADGKELLISPQIAAAAIRRFLNNEHPWSNWN